jgi:hypothetical protein
VPRQPWQVPAVAVWRRTCVPGSAITDRCEVLGLAVTDVEADVARDVHGALEAAIRVVRLRRPGNDLDPDGPRPQDEIGSIDEIRDLLAG